jgi:hypothetical protein
MRGQVCFGSVADKQRIDARYLIREVKTFHAPGFAARTIQLEAV